MSLFVTSSFILSRLNLISHSFLKLFKIRIWHCIGWRPLHREKASLSFTIVFLPPEIFWRANGWWRTTRTRPWFVDSSDFRFEVPPTSFPMSHYGTSQKTLQFFGCERSRRVAAQKSFACIEKRHTFQNQTKLLQYIKSASGGSEEAK